MYQAIALGELISSALLRPQRVWEATSWPTHGVYTSPNGTALLQLGIRMCPGTLRLREGFKNSSNTKSLLSLACGQTVRGTTLQALPSRWSSITLT